jgi:hypothetical protein
MKETNTITMENDFNKGKKEGWQKRIEKGFL